jgi:hypothetical protein
MIMDLHLSESRAQVAQAAGHVQADAVLEREAELTGGDGLHVPDSTQIDNSRAIHAHETGWFEPGFHGGHGFTQNVTVFAHMENHVIARRFHVIDFVRFQEKNSIRRLYQYAFRGTTGF